MECIEERSGHLPSLLALKDGGGEVSETWQIIFYAFKKGLEGEGDVITAPHLHCLLL